MLFLPIFTSLEAALKRGTNALRLRGDHASATTRDFTSFAHQSGDLFALLVEVNNLEYFTEEEITKLKTMDELRTEGWEFL